MNRVRLLKCLLSQPYMRTSVCVFFLCACVISSIFYSFYNYYSHVIIFTPFLNYTSVSSVHSCVTHAPIFIYSCMLLWRLDHSVMLSSGNDIKQEPTSTQVQFNCHEKYILIKHFTSTPGLWIIITMLWPLLFVTLATVSSAKLLPSAVVSIIFYRVTRVQMTSFFLYSLCEIDHIITEK